MKNHTSRLLGILIVASSSCLMAAANGILAQRVIAELKAGHPEVSSLEIAATPPGRADCKTVAATDEKEIGTKCDRDEVDAMKTNQLFIEKEDKEFDATVPIHDSSGNVIGTAGLDFAADLGQTKETVMQKTKRIVGELEKRIQSKEQLFQQVQ